MSVSVDADAGTAVGVTVIGSTLPGEDEGTTATLAVERPWAARLSGDCRESSNPVCHDAEHVVAVPLQLRRADTREREQLVVRPRLRVGDRDEHPVREDVVRRNLLGRGLAAAPGDE